jgi:hypothetical protein
LYILAKISLMPDKSSFNTTQNQLLQVLIHGFNDGKDRLLVSMPSGTGKSALLSAFLQNILSKLSLKDRVFLIVQTKALQSQIRVRLSMELDIPVSEFRRNSSMLEIGITICLLSELDLVTEVLRLANPVEIRLVIMPDADEHSLKRADWNAGVLGAKLKIAITDYPYAGEGYGIYDFVYSTAQAIEDDLLRKVHYVHVGVSLSERQDEILAELDQLQDTEEAEINMKLDAKSYLEVVCEDIYSRVMGYKTVIFASNIYQADLTAELLNIIGESIIARPLHSSMSSEKIGETLGKFWDMETTLNILVLVNLSPVIINGGIKNVVLLRQYSSLRGISDIVNLAQQKSVGIEHSTVYDYRKNFRLFDQLFSTLDLKPSLEEVKVPRKYLSESRIRFRDKSDIDPVLGANEIAAELAEIIQIIPGEQGSMIGVFGMWGRGKTFLMELLWKELSKNKGFIRVDFHAWKYQDTPATWAYIYESFAERYFEGSIKRNWVSQWWFQFMRIAKLNWGRQKALPFLKVLGLATVAISLAVIADSSILLKLGLTDKLWLLKYSALLTGLGYLVGAVAKKEFSSKAKDVFLKYSTKHSFKDHLGLQAEIQKETLTLLKTWIPDKKLAERKIVLLVEDIDRCAEQKVIQLIDSLRVLLEDVEIAKRVVILAAVDERILKLAIKNKYHALLSLEKLEAEEFKIRLDQITDEYMDKLFISGIKLGDLSTLDRDDFIKELTKADRSQELALRVLQEVIEDDRRYEDSKMSAHLQDILIHDSIERQHEQDDVDGGLFEDYVEPDYHTEILEPSKPLPNGPSPVDLGQLSEEEVDIVRLAVSRYKDATPRQIRIFYYRYLMAKNLLARRYRTLSKTNVWIRTRNAKIIANLIIQYTTAPERDLLEKHLAKAINCNTTNMDIKLLTYTAAKTADYRELLQVLSVVIAY